MIYSSPNPNDMRTKAIEIRNILMVALCMIAVVGCGGSKTEDDKKNDKSEPQTETEEVEAVSAESFGDLLVELESNLGWEAVAASWKDRREPWITECQELTSTYVKNTAYDRGLLLKEFEAIVDWSAVNIAWKDRRDGWRKEIEETNTDAGFGKLLVEFESFILWDVVSPDWSAKRDGWIKRCQSLSDEFI